MQHSVFVISYVMSLLSIVASSPITPVFPVDWIHTAKMVVGGQEDLNHHLVGRSNIPHSNGDAGPVFLGQNVLCSTEKLAHVGWIIHAGNNSMPFKFILDGSQTPTQYYQIDQDANCTVEAYPTPLFNPAWASNITYGGSEWFDGTLCDKWNNAFLYFGHALCIFSSSFCSPTDPSLPLCVQVVR